MNFNFNKEEQKEFLRGLGYTTDVVKYDIGSVYPDEQEYLVSYKVNPPETWSDILNCRLEYVFNNELKKKLLSL